MSSELWSVTVGTRPHTVWVGELADKGRDVYLRFYVGGKRKLEKTTTARVRDDRGRLAARRTQAAEAEAEAKAKDLRAGIVKPVQPAPASPPPAPAAAGGAPQTVQQGVDLAFSLKGCYPLDPDTHVNTRESRGHAAKFIACLGGGNVRWEDITPGDVRSIWRRLELQTRRGGGGHRDAEKVVHCFYRIASWLAGEYPQAIFPRPIKRWRNELKAHWQQSRRKKIEIQRPRHSEDEAALLFTQLHLADPRVRLAMVLGAELRGGQVIQTMRSHCSYARGRWTVRVPYVSETKLAPPLLLNAAEAAELEAAMDGGYLRNLEAAYQAGEIEDYALFVAGKLSKGVAADPKSSSARPLAVRAVAPIAKTTLIKLFHEFEVAAGVPVVHGRAWHGMRRLMSNLSEPATSDGRVKDRLGGWTPGSTMRAGVYQDQESEEVDLAASEVRARTRPGFAGADAEPASRAEGPTLDEMLELIVGPGSGPEHVRSRMASGIGRPLSATEERMFAVGLGVVLDLLREGCGNGCVAIQSIDTWTDTETATKPSWPVAVGDSLEGDFQQ